MEPPDQSYTHSLYRTSARADVTVARPHRLELMQRQTLIPQQRIDPEISYRSIPRVFQQEPDYHLPWRAADQSGGRPVPMGSSTSLPMPDAPLVAYRFGVMSEQRGYGKYETAQANIQGRGTWVPSHVAMGRAQAIATGALRPNSTLMEYVSGVTAQPTATELTMRRMVRTGAMAPAQAPVERRRDQRDLKQRVLSLETPTVPEHALVGAPEPPRVMMPPRMRRSHLSDCHLRRGELPLMSGALPDAPSEASPPSMRASVRRSPSTMPLSRPRAPLRVCNAEPWTLTPSSPSLPSPSKISPPPSSRAMSRGAAPSLRRSAGPARYCRRRLSDASSTSSIASFKIAPESQPVPACLRRKPVPQRLAAVVGGDETPKVDSWYTPSTPVVAGKRSQGLGSTLLCSAENMAHVVARLEQSIPAQGAGDSGEVVRRGGAGVEAVAAADAADIEETYTTESDATDTTSEKNFSIRSKVSTVKGKVATRAERSFEKVGKALSVRSKGGKKRYMG